MLSDFQLAGYCMRPVAWPAEWEAYAEERLSFSMRRSVATIEVRYAGPTAMGDERNATIQLDDEAVGYVASGCVGTFDRKAATLTVMASADPPSIGLNNALRLFVSVMLPIYRDGLMLHAASCILEGRGVAIAGVSGAGKSTFANGLQEATYLTDDITLVDRLSTEPRLLATPFHGSLGRVGADEEADLNVVGILSQSDGETVIRRLRPAEAATSLLRHVVAFSSDKRLTGPILDRVTSLVANVPVFDVARSLGDSSDEVCRKLLAAAEASA